MLKGKCRMVHERAGLSSQRLQASALCFVVGAAKPTDQPRSDVDISRADYAIAFPTGRFHSRGLDDEWLPLRRPVPIAVCSGSVLLAHVISRWSLQRTTIVLSFVGAGVPARPTPLRLGVGISYGSRGKEWTMFRPLNCSRSPIRFLVASFMFPVRRAERQSPVIRLL